jgi:hypothetical protein
MAAANAQVSAPRRFLSYEVRDQSRTLHNFTFDIEGFVVSADSAQRNGNEFTLQNATLTFPRGADVTIRTRQIFSGGAIQNLPTK